MKLTLIPTHGRPGFPEMAIHVDGDVLTLDGVALDLSAVPEGGEGWPPEDEPRLLYAPITRTDGVLNVSIIARLGPDADPHQDGPWVIEGASGDVQIPAKRKTEEQTA